MVHSGMRHSSEEAQAMALVHSSEEAQAMALVHSSEEAQAMTLLVQLPGRTQSHGLGLESTQSVRPERSPRHSALA